MMNIENLLVNIIDQIKELQIKLGYARETVRLYYPAASLSALVFPKPWDNTEPLNNAEPWNEAEPWVDAKSWNEAEPRADARSWSDADVESLCHQLCNHPDLANSRLGRLEFSVHDGRIMVSIPPEGVVYVHEQVPEPAFLKDLVTLFQEHHGCSLADVEAVFAKYSSHYICEKMPEGTDFDYCIRFLDGQVDNYYYCLKAEMGHMIYHRFTKADYEQIVGSSALVEGS